MEYLLLYNTGSFKADGGGDVDLAIELWIAQSQL